MSKFINYIFLLTILLSPVLTQSQETKPPIVFEHNHGVEIEIKTEGLQVEKLLDQEGITLDHGSTQEILKLYVTREGLNYIDNKKIKYSFIEREPFIAQMKSYKEISQLKDGTDCLPVFDFYPTYEAYEQIMSDFQSKYPDICKLDTIYTWANGRQLLVVNIGDNVGVQENEPGFLYTSTMHGDELAGYPTMIKFIDYLLCNYNKDERITSLLNEINIFINPLANPNGAYTNDNSTVVGARRENASFIDLNRNYPDPDRGQNPDGRTYQSETLAFMEFAETDDINMSCNIHGGTEVLNYPWDTFVETHADDDWWVKVCRNFADTVQHNSPSGYLDEYDNGITNGFAWYRAVGGRQDYMTYFKRGREFTHEISNQKQLNSDKLPDIWNYNRDAFINYMNEALFGLRGTIVDCQTAEPVEAEVLIEGHDNKNSSVFSRETDGAYFRYLEEGDYLVSFIAEGYDTIVQNLSIDDKVSTVFDVELCSLGTSSTEENIAEGINIYQNEDILVFEGEKIDNNTEVKIFDINGKLIIKSNLVDKSISLSTNISTGIYWIILYIDNVQGTKKLLIK